MSTPSYPASQVNQSPEPRKSRLLAAALRFASKGIPVFPCRPGGKEPLVSGGFKAATRDPRKIRMWWSRWPDANIGVPTGAASGILALDVDEGGDETLDRLIGRNGGELPETLAITTGGGGRHYWFAYPEREVRNSAKRLGPGLDRCTR